MLIANLSAAIKNLDTGIMEPATKFNAAVRDRFDASEPHPNPVDAAPDYLCCAPNSGERVLKVEAARQPALPSKRQLRSASGYVANTTWQRTALRNEHLCGAVDVAARVSPSLH
jgi:hypothetical protein